MASATARARRALARATKPLVCYAVEGLPAKSGGEALHAALRTTVASGAASCVQKLTIPARDARSWRVPAGHLWRIVCTEGPQVADMNCWAANDPTERFFTSKTRQLHATHLTTGDRLWSNMPFLWPLATIV